MAKQLPYLASASVPGAALLIVGAVLLAPVLRGRGEELAAVDRLVELLTEPLPEAEPATTPAPSTDDGRLVAVPAGTHYHRSSCTLVSGKPDATIVDAKGILRRDLHPCPACRPDAPTSGAASSTGET